MTIDGWTILLQAVNFLVLVWLLRRFLYRPVLAVIAAREAETAGNRAAAAALQAAAETASRAVEAERAGIAAEHDRSIADALAAAEAERAALLDKARAEADRLLAEARARIADERGDALQSLKRSALALGTGLSQRLLRDLAPDATPLLFERACAALAALPAERRDALLPADGRIAMAAAADPGDAQRAAWTQRLSALLGRPVRLDLEVDPDLVAGVELRFPGLILAESWRDALARAGKELMSDDQSHAEHAV
ncbi:hypothetical protein [Azospirillum thermophilum]|uniref:ATP synthase subunit b n=1 Tax=Azospirillum thermophilum TaxID=2202148 RepID=A0A2S2CUI8_9PROT|nr:hypothetical protein [Azospirillum thermophilum]AWK88183.1 hypothetical protein DEW08_18880 [Azospirillum thermophilum]